MSEDDRTYYITSISYHALEAALGFAEDTIAKAVANTATIDLHMQPCPPNRAGKYRGIHREDVLAPARLRGQSPPIATSDAPDTPAEPAALALTWSECKQMLHDSYGAATDAQVAKAHRAMLEAVVHPPKPDDPVILTFTLSQCERLHAQERAHELSICKPGTLFREMLEKAIVAARRGGK